MHPARPNELAAAAPAKGVPGASNKWSSGLFDCFNDCGLCCLTWWCPCITFGRIAEMLDRGALPCAASGALYACLLCSTRCCQCMYSCNYRTKMRAQFNLPEGPCCDCCVHLFCEPCALCQQYRELQARGFDPVLGWHANEDRRRAAMYPPDGQGMDR